MHQIFSQFLLCGDIFHVVAKSQTRLRDFTFTFHFHALEKEMATHSNVLAWRIPGTAEPGGLPSMGWHRARHDWSDLAAAAAGSLSWWCSCFPSIFLFIYSGDHPLFLGWKLCLLDSVSSLMIYSFVLIGHFLQWLLETWCVEVIFEFAGLKVALFHLYTYVIIDLNVEFLVGTVFSQNFEDISLLPSKL